jgi:hypothetical protein
MGLQGGFLKEPVSDHKHADERCCRGRQNRVVLTPRRWRQVCGRQVGPTGRGQARYPQDDGGKRARSPGRARHKLLKPLRAGMPGVPVYSLLLVCVLPIQSAHETAGAAGTRHSPRPPWGREINARLGRFAPRDLYACLEIVVASGAKQSILSLRGEMDCFASLAMAMRPFENEAGVCAKRSLRSLLETHPSCGT